MRILLTALLVAAASAQPQPEMWRFDSIDRLGDHTATVQGHPRVIETPQGKAVQFNGKDDALFLDVHPLAGAETFTWEVVFRPESGGAAEQRFFHFQQDGDATRLLLEIRVIGDRWCLDGYARSGENGVTLIDHSKLFPLGAWYQAALVYDGRQLRTYVNGTVQASAEIRLVPQGPGHTSIGTRIDRRDYFKGAIRVARISRTALSVAEFLRPE